MDWKKETMSAAELEKRQAEYMNAAISMMKRSSPSAAPSAVPSAPPAAGEAGRNGGLSGAAVPSAESEPVKGEAKEPTVKAEPEAAPVTPEPAEASEHDREPVPDEEPKPKETKEAVPEEAPETGEKADESGNNDPDTKYGVYTADEIISGEYRDDGLRKAAEILEEMTRNTEMMKKLADGENDPDTTDFPDFSCKAEGEDGSSFREEKKECEETVRLSEGCAPADE